LAVDAPSDGFGVAELGGTKMGAVLTDRVGCDPAGGSSAPSSTGSEPGTASGSTVRIGGARRGAGASSSSRNATVGACVAEGFGSGVEGAAFVLAPSEPGSGAGC
jgi:hypothetical protein